MSSIPTAPGPEPDTLGTGQPRWAKVIDHTTCIGCHACTTACKSENEVPLGVTRTYVKYADVGTFPEARRAFQVTRCNQCADSPCTTACPTSAMYRRPDGIVDFDKNACIGCKACIAACPYDAIFINPEDHSAEKCNFCAHRIDVGLEPACVVVCPTESIFVGDLDDPGSRVAQTVHRDAVQVRRPEKNTRPKLFYKGAHQATLDPLAARRPEGGLFLWSEQKTNDPHDVVAGHPGRTSSSAEAILAYDVPHKAPWDWRVSLYTLTKGIAAGAYLVPVLLIAAGFLEPSAGLWRIGTPVMGLVFLVITLGVLISDLEQPRRFYYILLRPQWRSWLARGAVILGVYGAVLAAHATATFLDLPERPSIYLAVLGVPAAIMAAVYTAFLFAQAKARDLWQSPLLPPHLLLQALLAGAAALTPFAHIDHRPLLLAVMSICAALHLLFVWGEIRLPHVTAHAKLAIDTMTHGAFRKYFLGSLALFAVVILSPALIPTGFPLPWLTLLTSCSALLGLLAYEHAYVQAGQSVPLA
ncbi:MAG: polysulfide reductase NrfD [Thermoanaerobaculia bacterium]|nr:polysulfide reductase NrfD [Thermoanaerobaculia bacterium]